MYNNNKSCGCGRERCGCNRNEQECQTCRRSTENCCQENYGFDWGDPVPQPEQRQPGCRWPCGSCQTCPDPQPTECEVQLAECREQLRIAVPALLLLQILFVLRLVLALFALHALFVLFVLLFLFVLQLVLCF